jgi:hypothetical protein
MGEDATLMMAQPSAAEIAEKVAEELVQQAGGPAGR